MKFIQVGVGGFGGVWAKTLRENKDVEVVGLVDINPAVLEKTCQEYGYSPSICFSDLKKAIRQCGAEALVCVTPPAHHKHDVILAMKNGLHTISEKPMADSIAACRAMTRAARLYNRHYVVSQNYRYTPDMWTMASLVKSGRLGRIGQVKIDFYLGVDFKGGFRHTMEYPLIVDMSIHHFDLIRFITGLDAVEVRATAWNPLWSNYQGDCSSSVLFRMNNEARILYNGSWCAKGQFCNWNGNWQIEGEKGTLLYDPQGIRILQTDGLYSVQKEEKIAAEPPPLGGQQYVLDDFLRAVRDGRRAATDCTDNFKSIAMVLSTVKAMRTGKTTPVDAE